MEKKSKIGCEKIAYMGQNMLLLEAHTYKWLISIFKEIASVLLFGLGVKCLEIQLFGLQKTSYQLSVISYQLPVTSYQ